MHQAPEFNHNVLSILAIFHCINTKQTADSKNSKIYSYVYDDSNPNICLSLLFRNQADATEFEETVLKLSIPPVSSWYAGSEARFVHK